MDGEQPCDICGTVAMSNVRLRTEMTVRYHDGPPSASLPSIIICTDCADEVSEYIDRRTDDPDDPPAQPSPFSKADAEAMLDRLKADPTLVLDPGWGYGIRYVDATWKQAHAPRPAPPQVRTLDLSEVIEIIQGARRVTLKQLDREQWRRFESDLH